MFTPKMVIFAVVVIVPDVTLIVAVPAVFAVLCLVRKNCCDPATVLVVVSLIESTRMVLLALPVIVNRSVGVAGGVQVLLAE